MTPSTAPTPAAAKATVDTVPNVRPDVRSPSTLFGQMVPWHAFFTVDAFDNAIPPVTLPAMIPTPASENPVITSAVDVLEEGGEDGEAFVPAAGDAGTRTGAEPPPATAGGLPLAAICKMTSFESALLQASTVASALPTVRRRRGNLVRAGIGSPRGGRLPSAQRRRRS